MTIAELSEWAEQATQLDPIECKVLLIQMAERMADRPEPKEWR
jgi:hypothetical protein